MAALYEPGPIRPRLQRVILGPGLRAPSDVVMSYRAAAHRALTLVQTIELPMNPLLHSKLEHPQDGDVPGESAPTLDPDALERLTQLDPGNGRSFMLRVLQTYSTALQRYLCTLESARMAGNIRLVGETAHTIKSSSAAIGAEHFAALCAQVERLAKAANPEAMGQPLTRLLEEAVRVERAVRAILVE